jgi:aspartyl aminopeptidase
MKKSTEFAQELVEFCYESPTAYHAVENAKQILEKKKFIQLFEEDKWDLKPGKKYYMTRNDSALVAFVMGSKKAEQTGFRIVGAHTDSPCFRIKPAPEMVSEGKYLRLNTEVYGK